MTVTSPDEGISDRRKYGEALGKGRGLHTGIPDYLPLKKPQMLLRKLKFTEIRIRHFTLFKVLLPDDISDPTGRGITFSKKAGI